MLLPKDCPCPTFDMLKKMEWDCVTLLGFKVSPLVKTIKIECSVHFYRCPCPNKLIFSNRLSTIRQLPSQAQSCSGQDRGGHMTISDTGG